MGKMLNTNLAFREYAKEKNVKMWEVAEKVGVNDGNFSRRLRHELPLDELIRLKGIVDNIVTERGHE